MPLPDLIHALHRLGQTDAAARLERLPGSARSFDLHLRDAGLAGEDAGILAKGLHQLSRPGGPTLRSFSASYNPGLGDAGIIALAKAFPQSMTELGLVGCAITDPGGQALLDWAETAPLLGMICVEGNRFSPEMAQRLRGISSAQRRVMVVV